MVVKYKKINIKHEYILIFLILVFNYSIGSTLPQYFVSAIILFIFLIKVIKDSIKVHNVFKEFIDFFPAFMILTWLYGVIVGITNDVSFKFVFSNFAGMSLYFIYYFIVIYKLNVFHLYKVIFAAAIVNIAYILFNVINVGFVERSIDVMGHRYYYSPGVMVIAPIISLGFARICFSKKYFEMLPSFNFSSKVLLFISIYSLAIATFSKGFFAAFIFILLIYLLLSLFHLTLKGIISKVSLYFWFGLLVVISVAVFLSPIIEIISFQYSSSESSNAVRSIQAKLLSDEYSLFGSGLGSGLTSGHARDQFLYGFELSYHNLIHKLGIFSLIPFYIYVHTLIMSIYRLAIRRSIFLSSIAFGLIIFVIPSYGNPMLFSPVFVTLHCLSLFFLSNRANLQYQKFHIKYKKIS
jgi:hypothetical protein